MSNHRWKDLGSSSIDEMVRIVMAETGGSTSDDAAFIRKVLPIALLAPTSLNAAVGYKRPKSTADWRDFAEKK